MNALVELFESYHEESKDPVQSVHDGMESYTRYVVENRALPSMCDGLKPAQRIALWTMIHYVGRNKKVKSVALAGTMLGSNLYAHGDSSAAGAVQMMAGPYINNECYLTGHGAFGTVVEPRAFGAPRYTSVSLSEFTKNVMLIDEDLHEMVPSVDGDTEMCRSFLPLIPTVLLQGTEGMAIGYSTKLLPHSVEDLKQAVLDTIDGKQIDDISPFWKNYVCDVIEDEGRSLSYFVKGKVDIENTTTVRIKSIHPDLTLEKLKQRLIQLQEAGDIQWFNDRTSDKIDIEVKFTRSNLFKHDEDSLVRLFKLEKRFSERLVMIGVDGKVKVYESHAELLEDFVEWRFGFYTKRFERQLRIAEDRLSFLRDVIRCFDAELPAELPSIKSKKELAARVKEICEGRDRSAIVEYATFRWTDEYRKKAEAEIAELEKEKAHCEDMLGSERKRKNLFKREVKAV